MGLTATGWVPAVALAILGLLLLAVPVPRALGALRRTRASAETLRTALTGRGRRINAGLGELQAWRAAHRGGEPAEAAGGGVDGGVDGRADA